jgi:hypothetical protein
MKMVNDLHEPVDYVQTLRDVDLLVDRLLADHADTVFDIAASIKATIAPLIRATSNIIYLTTEAETCEERLNRLMSTEHYYAAPELGENRDW